jgi:hypothetical protein
VTISNTERELLDYVLTQVVAGKITKKKTAQSHHTPSLTYAIYNRQALSLLKQITPYLRTYKRHRAEYIFQHYLNVTPRNGKYSKELLDARKKFEIKVLNILPEKQLTK